VTEHPYATDDGAYLLGALSPGERRDYEAHLSRCLTCTIGVRELAGLPGLLARIRPVDFHDADDRPVTSTRRSVLRTVLETVRARRRTLYTLVAFAVAVAAAAALLSLVLGVPRTGDGRPSTPPPKMAIVAMTHVVPAPIDASVQLTGLGWGTSILIRCRYPDRPPYATGPYQLVVIDRTGHVRQVASWQVVPGQISTISASLDLSPTQLAWLEVRTLTGQTVLRAAG
jgi:Predicted transmembrane transcriptional regulator (anti-sigma factor)